MTTTSIESVITSNPKIATHPKLDEYCSEYMAALAGGYEPDPALMTEMFAALVTISTTDPVLAGALTSLKTEIVEQVIVRDVDLAANAQLGSMLAYYSGQIAGGYEADETTTTAIVGALEGVTTSDPVLQDLLDDVTEVLAPPLLPTSFGVSMTHTGASGETGMLGVSVSGAGDINGDGLDDFLVGAYWAADDRGQTHVVYGTEDGFAPTLDLADLDGTSGFTVTGAERWHRSGYSVSAAGDVNGDEIDDILIGAWGVGTSNAGAGYVVFGRQDGFAPTLDLASLDGTNGFVMAGTDGDWSGWSVAGAGDVNGDGLDDVIIGAPQGGLSGGAYVVLGGNGGFDPIIDLGSLDGSDGTYLAGSGGMVGNSVSGAGDVNGDGIDDILVGAPYKDRLKGETYVVFGTSSGFQPSMELSALDGLYGFTLKGWDGESGAAVSKAGDVNGDGVDDILIGARYAEEDASGETYVIFGDADGFAPTLDLASLNGTNGFAMKGQDFGGIVGRSVASAGDVNGDGIDDILIGANGTDSDAGAAYVVYGSAEGFAPSMDLDALDGTDGFVLKGVEAGDQAGWSVSSAGDANGDGTADLLIGAIYANSLVGESYLVYGGDDILDRFDLSDGTRDGVIHLANLGLNPADYDVLA